MIVRRRHTSHCGWIPIRFAMVACRAMSFTSAARAGAVIDQELLPHHLGEPLRNRVRRDFDGTAGTEWNYDADGPGRIAGGLRCNARGKRGHPDG